MKKQNVLEFIEANPNASVSDIVKHAHELYSSELAFYKLKDWQKNGGYNVIGDSSVKVNPEILRNSAGTYSVLSSSIKTSGDTNLYISPRIYAKDKAHGAFSSGDRIPNFEDIKSYFSEDLDMEITETSLLERVPVVRKRSAIKHGLPVRLALGVFKGKDKNRSFVNAISHNHLFVNADENLVSEAQQLMQMADTVCFHAVRHFFEKNKKWLDYPSDEATMLYASQLLADMKVIDLFRGIMTATDDKSSSDGEKVYDKMQKFLTVEFVRCLNGLDASAIGAISEIAEEASRGIANVFGLDFERPVEKTEKKKVVKKPKEPVAEKPDPEPKPDEDGEGEEDDKDESDEDGEGKKDKPKKVSKKRALAFENYNKKTLRDRVNIDFLAVAKDMQNIPEERIVAGKVIKINKNSKKFKLAAALVTYFGYNEFLEGKKDLKGKELREYERKYYGKVIEDSIAAETECDLADIKDVLSKLTLTYNRSKGVKKLFEGNDEIAIHPTDRAKLTKKVVNTTLDSFEK